MVLMIKTTIGTTTPAIHANALESSDPGLAVVAINIQQQKT